MDSPLILSLKRQSRFYGSKIKILSPAKINLYLNIIGKYPAGLPAGQAGFHRLESVVERISLCDEVTLRVKKDPAINISCNYKKLETRANLIFKTLQLLKRKFKIPFGFDVLLRKKIPAGSGLGGGSSNAASAFLGANALLGLKLKTQELYQLGTQVGSDVNFFLSGSRFAFLTGRGEKVEPLDIKKTFSHFIIWPRIELSTRRVYKNARVNLTKVFNNVKILKYALKRGDTDLIKRSVFNALERGAYSLCAELREVKEYLRKRGIFARMTGSGSAFYTFSLDTRNSKLRATIPDKWPVFGVTTF